MRTRASLIVANCPPMASLGPNEERPLIAGNEERMRNGICPLLSAPVLSCPLNSIATAEIVEIIGCRSPRHHPHRVFPDGGDEGQWACPSTLQSRLSEKCCHAEPASQCLAAYSGSILARSWSMASIYRWVLYLLSRNENMPYARVFQSGNSQAVRLPKEFRFQADRVEIYRRGDELVMREAPINATAIFDALAGMPPDSWPMVARTHRRRTGTASDERSLPARHQHLHLHRQAQPARRARALCSPLLPTSSRCRSSRGRIALRR